MPKKLCAVGLIVIALTVAMSASQAFAATHQRTEHFSISYASARDVVLAHGPVVGSGRVDVYASKDVLHLGHGTLMLTFDPSKFKATGGVGKKSCFFHCRIRAPYTLGHGTGRYRGVTGHGVLRGTEQALGHRNADGSCRNGHFRDEVAFFTAAGPVRSDHNSDRR